MNKIDNSTKIEMLCELAHNRVLEEENKLNSKGKGTTLFEHSPQQLRRINCFGEYSIIENIGEGQYTEDGQELFNEYYDYYESIILSYIKEVK